MLDILSPSALHTLLFNVRVQGIGRAIVEELASLGANVLTCSRTEGDVTACVAVSYSGLVCLLLSVYV